MIKPTIQDRRRYKRRNLSYYLPIVDNDSQQTLGHLVDISLVGIMIDCKRSIPSGQHFNLRLDLMEGVGEKPEIEFSAQCKWCRADKIQPYLYNAGFEITRISEADREVIRRISEKYGAGDK
jgi:hypothetical protein